MNFFKKWYTYQKERFPVVVFGAYMFCIVFAVFCFVSYLAPAIYDKIIKTISAEEFIMTVSPALYVVNYFKLIPMFAVAFLQFLMIRIVDEFKDYEEDCKYRPYRPVPRGLVTLKELKVLFVICAIMQLTITVFAKASLLWLAILWAFFGLLSKDFFIKKFIDKHILVGVFLDELLMPVLVLYLFTFIYYIDYSSIWPILLISYIISWIVEIARKVRCKEDEEEGVKTYTAVFGIGKAVFILFVLETLLMLLQLKVLGTAHLTWILGTYILVSIINLVFVEKQTRKSAKMTELSANLYIIFVCLSMGLLII